jgi:predicted ABC-type ATPase
MSNRPLVIILAGPNGAGKSTAATWIVPPEIVFVNADEVAKTLPGYPSRAVDLQAGRLVLEAMERLESERAEFAVETTLASRSLAPRLSRMRRSGYRTRLIFVFLTDVELSIARVARRVRLGGHHIPEETIRRRHAAGIRNFFELYRPLSDRWAVYDTTRGDRPRLIAAGRLETIDRIREPILWDLMKERAGHE